MTGRRDQQGPVAGEELVGAIAAQVADLLLPVLTEAIADRSLPRVMNAGEVAELLGVSRDAVYANADLLGAIRLRGRGTGRRPALRFVVTPETVQSWTARSASGGSQAPKAAPRGASRMSTPSRSGKPVPLLPIGGSRRGPGGPGRPGALPDPLEQLGTGASSQHGRGEQPDQEEDQ